MKNIIVYFPYKLSDNPKTGSSVRPHKMVEAFKLLGNNYGVEIIVISGESKQRKREIKEFINSEKIKKTLFCYMENSTMPYWLTDEDHIPRHPFSDIRFWKYLKKNNVPIGLFYRDIYWKFKELYTLEGAKKLLTPVMRAIYQKELRQFHKIVDVLYLPSLEMNEYVGWDGNIEELPPGIDVMRQLNPADYSDSLNLIYVGAINDLHGMKVLLEAMERVYKEIKAHLFLVCRENEYRQNNLLQQHGGKPWLTIKHLSGKPLEELYEKVDVGLIPRKTNVYHNFSVPVKLFEYLSYGLPLVVTNCKAQERIISEGQYGMITSDNPTDYAEGILALSQKKVYANYKNNILSNAFDQHSWYARVEKVYTDFLNR